ncbi:hypothetical protein CAPTEDRAFT_193999 [Capitella teleta]|uniref:Uncharacterized protein n=1 Tax=Capitella teleta TaxID=283909 RepID=R7T3Q4_CAPTE|nr:hypothetical protein CAPTEDRAFT_193999 [Capitella teleta]|eukprot:ELT87281.1 hypothetical protein CAPTEDRAFT_193999 [Capitella teleta]
MTWVAGSLRRRPLKRLISSALRFYCAGLKYLMTPHCHDDSVTDQCLFSARKSPTTAMSVKSDNEMDTPKEDNNNEIKSDAFVQSRIYSAIAQLRPHSWKEVAALVNEGEDVNLRGAYNETYLHVLAAPRPDDAIPHVEAIAYVLSEGGVDVNAKDQEGNTVLHVSAMNDMNHRLAAALLRIGVDPCLLNNEDQDAIDLSSNDDFKRQITLFDPGLWRAVNQKNKVTVAKLVKYFCKVDAMKDGKSLLEMSRELGNKHITKSLEKYRKTSEVVHTALSGNSEKLKDLVAKDSSLCQVMCDGYLLDGGQQVSWPLLAETIRVGMYDCAKILMQHCSISEPLELGPGLKVPLCVWATDFVTFADTDFKMELFQKADLTCVENRLDLMYRLWRKRFPSGVLEVLVLQHGWDPTQRDPNGYTLRDLIFMDTLHLPREEMLENVAFVDQVFLKLAANGDKEKLETFAVTGYEYINVIDLNGRTSMELAEENGQIECAEFLKKLPTLQANASRLHTCIRAANLQEARELMDVHMMRARDRAGRTALHKAILYEKIFITNHIVQNFKDVLDHQDSTGKTALHYARCMKDREDLVELLVQAGANQNIKDQDGLTPSEFAEKFERDFIELERTKEYGGDIYILERYLAFSAAIQLGDADQLRTMVESLLQYDLNDFKTHLEQSHMDQIQYRSLVFLCIDHGQTEMAKYLISVGADCNEPGLVYTEEDSQLVLPIDYANMMQDYDLVEFIQNLPIDEERPSVPIEQENSEFAEVAPNEPIEQQPQPEQQEQQPQQQPPPKATSSACVIL